MVTNFRMVVLLVSLVTVPSIPVMEVESSDFKVLSGKPQMIVVNGYSTSFKWPVVLQRKLNK